MNKFLLAMCLGAAVMPASAEVTTFVAQGAPMCRYHGPADAKIVEMPTGFCWRQQSDSNQRGPEFTSKNRFMEKTMASDLVDVNEVWIKSDPANPNSEAVTLVPCSHIEAGTFRWPWDRVMQITPAAGVTVTSIKMKHNDPNKYNFPVSVIDVQGSNVNRVQDFVYNEADSTITLTGQFDKPFYIDNMGENYGRKAGTLRIIYMEITTTGTPTQVAMPVCKTQHCMLAKNEKVELTCSTPGAQIYYTIDYDLTWNTQTNHKPSAQSTLYTGPFSIEKDAVVRAIAVKDGMTPSFISYKEFYPMPEYSFVGEFNFNDYTSLKDEDGKQIADFKAYPVVNKEVSTSTVEKVSLAKTPAVDKDVTFTGTITNETTGDGCDLTLSNTFGGVVELRPLNGSVMYINVPDDKYISAVYMEATVSNAIVLNDGMAGTYKTGHINGTQKIWTNDTKDVNEVSLKVTKSSNYVDHLWVFYSNLDGSGVAEIEADTNAPAVYYNLQGVRVANPAKGQIYIKCQGSKATKVLF